MPAGDMDVEYSIGITNRFALVCNDVNDDPLELIQAALEKPSKKDKEPKGKGKKEVKPAKGAKEKSAKTETVPASNVPDSKRTEGSDRQRGRGRGGRGRGGERGRGRGRGGFASSDSPRDESASGFGDSSGGGSHPSSGSKGACHKCHKEGHFARECPNVESAPRSGNCHKCGEEGHFARQCPKAGPPGGGACHKCNEVGHFARECPQNNQSSGGFGDSSSSGFGAPSGGFGAQSGSGFGAQSGSGFGAQSGSGFGAPSEGFGAPSEGFGGHSGFGSPSGGFGGDDDSEKRGGRGGYRGRGRGGRGRGRGREFDRRSGSDKSSSVKASEKRDGAGAYNWGTPQDELEASEEQGGFGAPKESEDSPASNNEQTQEGGTDSGEENKENAGPQEITFEEWKSQQETRSKPQHNLRQANEGEKLKGVKQLKKPTEEENEADGSLFFPKKYYEEKLKTSGRVKEHMNLEFQFAAGDNRHYDTDRGRRGGRGGRGRGGRGGRKDNESGFGSSTKQIQLENTEEFPSLG